ncbi:MAG: UvrD-helicase domain-containing protein [Kiritimatiellaeota bacterium]|nr:UvrD-helicase domain-containing protein [Kiritimatiellota bacterium]
MTAFDVKTFDVSAKEGTTLIEANAGTGKTYTIQNLYRRFIEEGIKVSEILVVTFTEAATAELRERILSGLKPRQGSGVRGQGSENPADHCPLTTDHFLKLAAASFDEAAIFTIHGFCLRTLQRFAFEGRVPFDCELDTGSGRFREEAVRDFYRSRVSAEACPVLSLAQLQGFAKTAFAVPRPTIEFAEPSAKATKKAQAEASEIALLQELTAYLENAAHGIEARKAKARKMGFDDLLTKVHEAIRDGGGEDSPLAQMLRATYKVVLVDEFQDTDSFQYDIFNTVFGRHGTRLFMIGDPKQAIYGFRGGDVYAYLRAKEGVPPENRYTLTQNFRSSPRLIAAVNGLFSHAGIFLENDIDYAPSSYGEKNRDILCENGEPIAKPVKVVWFPGDPDGNAIAKTSIADRLLDEAAEQVFDLLENSEFRIQNSECGLTTDSPPHRRRILPSDIAVLVNENKECLAVQQRLREMNIPAVVYKSGNVFHSQEAKDMFYILRASLHPQRLEAVRTALLTAWCNVPSQSRRDDISVENTGQGIESRRDDILVEWGEKFKAIRDVWAKRGIVRALSEFERLFDARQSFVSRHAQCERGLVNWRHLQELLHHEERERRADPAALLSWLRQRINDGKTDNEAYEERLESDGDAVMIMTVHHSKGLQFPIVICPAVSLKEDGKIERGFPTAQGDGGKLLPVGEAPTKAYREAMRHERLAEAMRRLYVAMTRATNALMLIGGNVKYGRGTDCANAFNLLGKAQKKEGSGVRGQGSALEAPGAECPFGGEYIETEALNRHSYLVSRISNDERRMTNDDASTIATLPFIPDSYAIMSYTGMAQHGAEAFSERGGYATDTLPRGRTVGIALHEIFERLDFAKGADEKTVKATLKKYGLDASPRQVCDMVRRVLATPFPKTDMTLASLAPATTLREWTFYFPVRDRINTEAFTHIGLAVDKRAGEKTGFMTGSIDLLFRHGDAYCFADWKSDALHDYAPAALDEAMTSRMYRLQAILYSVALYRWLQNRLGASFDYARHFGGGYYLFLRGMADGNGIFPFRLPEPDLLRFASLVSR